MSLCVYMYVCASKMWSNVGKGRRWLGKGRQFACWSHSYRSWWGVYWGINTGSLDNHFSSPYSQEQERIIEKKGRGKGA